MYRCRPANVAGHVHGALGCRLVKPAAASCKLSRYSLCAYLLSSTFPCAGDCSSLVAFNASHNALIALPDSITRLNKLQVLAVDANK